MLDIVVSYHCMQFQEKLKNQIWENGEKPNFGPDFGPFCPNLRNIKMSLPNCSLSVGQIVLLKYASNTQRIPRGITDSGWIYGLDFYLNT